MDRGTGLTASRRSSTVPVDAAAAWAVVAAAGGVERWYVDALPLRFRATLDRAVGGPGRRWPVPARALLEDEDRAGFWRVTRADGRTLDLEATVRAPGLVRLTTRLGEAGPGRTLVSQQVSFSPSGLAGRVYLLADLPAREVVVELVHRRLLDAFAETR